MSKKPNILFVFTDQQTVGALGAAGNCWVSTPNMDWIAQRGVMFQHSYCTAPVCGPARASLVTGLMPHQVGANVNDVPLKDGVTSMGEIFRGQGYQTVWTGKWHVGEAYPTDQSVPGFDYRPPARITPYGVDTDPPTVDQAVEFIDAPHERPFLLAVSLHNPHDICHTVRREPAHWPPGEQLPPLPDNHRRDPHEPEFISRCRERTYYGEENTFTRHWTEQHWHNYLYEYYRLVEQVDQELGRILDALRARHLENETLIIFTSDHGEGVAAHELIVKLMLYEEPVKVPLLMCLPSAIPAGMVDDDHLVSGLDILPTMCDYAGIECPPVLGRSVKPLVDDPSLPGREFVVAELDTTEPDMTGRMLRTQGFKYVVFSQGSNPEMLFDLHRDPGETNNLALDPEHCAELARHRDMLKQWLDETNDFFQLRDPV